MKKKLIMLLILISPLNASSSDIDRSIEKIRLELSKIAFLEALYSNVFHKSLEQMSADNPHQQKLKESLARKKLLHAELKKKKQLYGSKTIAAFIKELKRNVSNEIVAKIKAGKKDEVVIEVPSLDSSGIQKYYFSQSHNETHVIIEALLKLLKKHKIDPAQLSLSLLTYEKVALQSALRTYFREVLRALFDHHSYGELARVVDFFLPHFSVEVKEKGIEELIVKYGYSPKAFITFLQTFMPISKYNFKQLFDRVNNLKTVREKLQGIPQQKLQRPASPRIINQIKRWLGGDVKVRELRRLIMQLHIALADVNAVIGYI